VASTIEQAVIDDLKSQSIITAYTTQIYFLEKDKGANNEYIVITNPSHTRNAILATGEAQAQARLQFNCFSRDKWTAKALAEAVKEVYRKRTGTIEGMTVHWTEIGDCRPLPGVSEHRYVLDIIFQYTE
jgi:hypothetical protein